jgi:hypothetical protein
MCCTAEPKSQVRFPGGRLMGEAMGPDVSALERAKEITFREVGPTAIRNTGIPTNEINAASTRLMKGLLLREPAGVRPLSMQ